MPVPPTPDPARRGDRRPLADVEVPRWRLRYVDRAGSTNALATEAVRAGTPPGFVIVTDHQQAGRGRLDRTWETPAGVGLTASFVVDPGQPDAAWPWLPLLTGLAAATAVRSLSGLEVGVKWPNDLLVGARKLAGILVERVPGGHGPVAVIGVGINVHQETLPVPGATSLRAEGVSVDRGDLLVALAAALETGLADWAAPGGPERLRAAYRTACVSLGEQVRVHLPGGAQAEGEAYDLDAQGRLVVARSDGRDLVVGAGDVVHVRRVNP